MSNSSKAGSILTKIILGGISVLIAEFLLSGVHVDTWITGFLLAAVIILLVTTQVVFLVNYGSVFSRFESFQG